MRLISLSKLSEPLVAHNLSQSLRFSPLHHEKSWVVFTVKAKAFRPALSLTLATLQHG